MYNIGVRGVTFFPFLTLQFGLCTKCFLTANSILQSYLFLLLSVQTLQHKSVQSTCVGQRESGGLVISTSLVCAYRSPQDILYAMCSTVG